MVAKRLAEKLIEENDLSYNVLKAAEESSELSHALISYLTKKSRDKEERLLKIAEELGDLMIRIQPIFDLVGHHNVQRRIDEKSEKILVNFQKYQNNA